MIKQRWLPLIAAGLILGSSARAADVDSHLQVAEPGRGSLDLHCDSDPVETDHPMVCWDSPHAWLAAMAGDPFSPQFDLEERPDSFVIVGDVPGVDEKDLDIRLDGTSLSIRGLRTEGEKQPGEHFFTRERAAGAFERRFTLPPAADADRMVAQVERGVLRIELPKKTAPEPRRVDVKAVHPAPTLVGQR
jgi:HSP20 family protein